MKRILLIILLTILFRQFSFSQNPEFPSGKTTIKFNSGKVIRDVQLWQIHDRILEYEKDASLHDALIEDIKEIKSGSAGYIIDQGKLKKIQDDLRTEKDTSHDMVSNSHSSEMYDYDKMGTDDAQKYYNGTGAFIGGFLGSIFIAPVIAAIPPGEINKKNPHRDLYNTNDVYRKSYRKEAHAKKFGNALGGLAAELLIYFAASFHH